MKPISPQQTRFVDELFSNGMNATKAYAAVGYSKRGADANAARLMARPGIKAEIGRRQAELRRSSKMTADEAVGILSRWARHSTNYRASLRAIELLQRFLGWQAPEREEETLTPDVFLRYRGLSKEARWALTNRFGPHLLEHPEAIEQEVELARRMGETGKAGLPAPD